MKRLLLLILICAAFCVHAQVNSDNIYKTWVVNKMTYKDGSSLPDDNALKFSYIKYTFGYPDKFRFSVAYYEKGAERSFEIKNGYLALKSPEGTTINTLKIEKAGDKLVLMQSGREGFDDPTSILFYLVPENVYQDSIQLKPNDIQSVIKGDTIYRQSPKIYASYNGDSFQRVMYNGMSENLSMDGRHAHFVASFIVTKKGVADSLKILESVDDKFDKRFIKVFNRAKMDWKPGVLNGKYVSVQMKVDLRYSTSETTLPAYFSSRKAIEAYNNKQYDIAEYYYNKALESEPADMELRYKRGMCKMLLGNMGGACEDWNEAKLLGGNSTIDAVLEKFCK